MNSRTFAFVIRSLRQESRLLPQHLLRAVLAGLILMMFRTVLALSNQRDGAGLHFAGQVVYCCYGVLSLLGAAYFSVAIVEEKEEQTLPLLRMTGAGPVTILLGKSLPRLNMVLLLLLTSAPFLILSQTLGGVLPLGLASSLLGLLTYSVMLSQLGCFSSVVCRSGRTALFLTGMIWALLEFGIWAGCMILVDARVLPSTSATWWADRSLMFHLSEYLTAWDSTEVWRPQMTFHLIVAAVFFGLSWLLFDRLTETATAGTAPATEGVMEEVLAPAGVARPRVEGNALSWKSWKYTTGGWLWFCIRLLVIPAAALVLIAVLNSGNVQPDDIGSALLIVGVLIGLLAAANIVGKVLNNEVREKTIHDLLLLPMSRTALVARLLQGLLPAVFSGFGCALIGFVVLLGSGEADVSDFMEILIEPAALHMVSWAALSLMLGLYLSVHMRYGAMVLAAVLCWLVAPVVLSFCVFSLVLSGGEGDGLFLFLMLGESLIAAVLWIRLIQDLEALGAKG